MSSAPNDSTRIENQRRDSSRGGVHPRSIFVSSDKPFCCCSGILSIFFYLLEDFGPKSPFWKVQRPPQYRFRGRSGPFKRFLDRIEIRGIGIRSCGYRCDRQTSEKGVGPQNRYCGGQFTLQNRDFGAENVFTK